MRKIFASLVFLGIGAAIVGCDSADHKKVESEKTYETTVEKPATVTEKTTTDVQVHENK